MTESLAPLVFASRLVPAIWGGDTLVRKLGKAGDSSAAIGESWECWDENAIANGPYAGKLLRDVRVELGARLVGTLDPTTRFPILTKFIDARRSLSVQVHPGDAYAQRVEGQPFGKTECWYILAAEPDAKLVLGWNRDIDAVEYRRRVADGTLADVLREVPVHAGDAFYLPAGTLHAIGAGILLYETQQASDLTYRIFDFNRLGSDGKPRELNVDKAADVLDFSKSFDRALDPLKFAVDGAAAEALVAGSQFAVDRLTLGTRPCTLVPGGLPLVVQALADPIELLEPAPITLAPYTCALIPAEYASYSIRAHRADVHALTAVPVQEHDASLRRYVRGGVSVERARAFLAQFDRSESLA